MKKGNEVMRTFHPCVRWGLIVGFLLVSVAVFIPRATAEPIPNGRYSLKMVLDGTIEDEREGDWPELPTGHVKTVQAYVNRYDRTSPLHEPEVDRSFIGSVVLTSGDRPKIQINGYSMHHSNPDSDPPQYFPPGQWDIYSQIEYYFNVDKKVDWAPDGPVSVQAEAYVSLYVSGDPAQHGVTAEARVTIPGGAPLTVVEATADWQDPNPGPHATEYFDVTPETTTGVSLYAHARGIRGILTGHENAQVIADPRITIDPTAMVTVNGDDYYATELYGVSFSPGFSDEIPEPCSFLLATVALSGLLACAWRKKSFPFWTVLTRRNTNRV